MKLIDRKSKKIIIAFDGADVQIPQEIFRDEMNENGITIPLMLREFYQGKEVVYLGDELFQKAFKEIYFKEHMQVENYLWLEA